MPAAGVGFAASVFSYDITGQAAVPAARAASYYRKLSPKEAVDATVDCVILIFKGSVKS